MRDVYLGRQPILDREQRVVAYELLFRAGNSAGAQVTDDVQATASVIQHAFGELGVPTVLGSQLGFINISTELLLSDLIELLPKQQVVLELLESVAASDAVVERCHALKQQGFRLALDDFVYDDSFRPLLELADIVKVDLLQHTPEALDALVGQLRTWPVKLLAEKVDSAEQAERCRTLGFELFQGYYFARPTLLATKRADPTQLALTQLLGLVLRDADTAQIEQVFKHHPNLTYNLMRLVNSVAGGARRTLSSVSQAILVLGRVQLQRWLQLLLFTLDSRMPYPSPLLLLAATRGKMMELLAQVQHRGSDHGEQAFMTGILSLIDALIDKPLADIVAELNLDARVAAALLRRDGELGALLQVVESVEHPDLTRTLELLQAAGGITLAALTRAQLDAMHWAHQIAEAGNE